jgi:predicted CopG family antitoxin
VVRPRTAVRLDRSAYELLLSRKRPDESLSEVLHRLLSSTSPDLKGFLDFVSSEDGKTVADAIESSRKQDLDGERKIGRPKTRRA